MFEDTANWHAQMQNESIKDTLKQIAKAYYKANTVFQNGTSAYEYVNSCVYSLDYLLYLEGAYCPDFYIYLGSNFR